MDNLEIKAITSDDFDEIYAIEINAYPFPWSEKILRSMLNGDEYKIKLTLCDKIIAYVFILVVLDEATILNIAVDPKHQGKGLGKQLLQYVKSDLIEKNIVSLFLEVRESNLAARALYESEGFHEIDIRKNYYPIHNGRENAVIMACSLMKW